MTNVRKVLGAAACAIFPGISFADFSAKVVAITDGDTLAVFNDHEQVKVRLAMIDAPEKKQPYGNRSKQSLFDLCFGKVATLTDAGKDRYGRTLATVHCDGIDANAEQVRRGLAWVYRKYAPKESFLFAIENEARQSGRGLWADQSPVPPWEWRRK